MIGRWTPALSLRLFDEPSGRYLENTAVYLYCRLISPDAQACRMLLGSDDSVKVWLNGKLVFQFMGQRSCSQDANEVPLTLQAGTNTLMVRVDNYVGNGGFCGRLTATNWAPLRGVSVQALAGAGTPELDQPAAKGEPWERVIAEIPPVPPAPHQDLFGARLARTMTLLESGGLTHRPIRIMFYGQSITAQEWTTLLINRLRERYPGATIEGINLALGGWGVDRLYRTLKHDILRARPDLICFHAYAGNQEMWERVVQNLRRETCADIILKTAHLAGTNNAALSTPEEDAETLTIRRMAQTYDCEIVEVRREWMNYLKTNNLGVTNMLCDSIHLNHKGNALMAQLYERHFRVNTLTPSGWADRVRYYEALRPFEDRKQDEITFTGSGWTSNWHWAESASPQGALHLTFTGNRVDVIVAPGAGSAKVLIDGKPPSAFNLWHGTLPVPGPRQMSAPWLMRYFEAPDILDETWVLTFTHATTDWRRFRYQVTGSQTGPDGEGDSEQEFVSKSGRIRIAPRDFVMPWPPPKPDLTAELKPLEQPPKFTWQMVPDFTDDIHAVPGPSDHMAPRCTYVTVADGLPFGKHELTLTPVGDAPIGIRGVEVYRPPLARLKGE